MENINFNKLLLQTAFSCMACDGDIDPREVGLIKKLHNDKNLFGNINLVEEIEVFRVLINENIALFIRDFFRNLESFELDEEQELKLIEVAIDTIKVDEEIKYSEIKFFKFIRSKLKISDTKILAIHSDFEEYLAKDIISVTYMLKLQNEFINTQKLPNFERIDFGDLNIIKEEDGKED
jgi:hypothetical protein